MGKGYEQPPVMTKVRASNENMARIEIGKAGDDVDNAMIGLYENLGFEVVGETRGKVVLELPKDQTNAIHLGTEDLHRQKARDARKVDLQGTGAIAVKDETTQAQMKPSDFVATLEPELGV